MFPAMSCLLLALAPLSLVLASEPPQQSIGLGSYYTQRPDSAPGPSNTAGNPVSPRITNDFSGPVPTNTWWSSLVWERYPGNTFGQIMHPHPLSAQADHDGLKIGQVKSPSPTGAGYGFHFTTSQHALTIGAVGLSATQVQVANAGDWTVTAVWEDGPRRVEATLGRGLPTVHATVSDGTPVVKTNPSAGPLTAVALSGNRVVFDFAGSSWAIYALAGGSWTQNGNDFEALGTSDIVAVVLPDRTPETLARFDQAAPVRIQDTRVSWEWNPSQRTVDATYTFLTDTAALPLVCLYGHQLAHLENTDLESWGTYPTARGPMTVTAATSFTVALPVPPLLPLLVDPGSVDSDRLRALLDQDTATAVFPSDTYWFGKAIGRHAQLALLADQQDQFVLRDSLLNTMKTELETWFSVESNGGLESANRLQGEQADSLEGVTVESVEGADGAAITGFGGGDWIRMSGIRFAEDLPLRALVRVASGTTGSGLLSLRLDSLDGPVVAQAGIGNTGGWTNWTEVALGIMPSDASVLAGVHDLYVTCETPYPSDIFSLDWVTFDYGGGPSGDPFLAYDPTWSTLIGYPASYGADTELNDHHFHYGYFIMAASVIARFDPEWAAADRWGGLVNLLIRDAANWDRTDERFCFLRHLEPYVGYSYASGHAGFAAGNNQESSSEALNFAAACVMWGAHTNQEDITELGLFLMAAETLAVESYWFDVDETVFPPPMPHPVAGIVWDSGADYATWWTGNQEEIHGINILPVTAASLYLGRRPDSINRCWNHLLAENGGPPTVWQDVLWSYLALADPDAALQALEANPNYLPEAGDSRARTYHWLSALRGLGRLSPEITGNAPLSAAFENQGLIRYVAHNPGSASQVVTFSDGYQLCVPAGKTVYAHTNQDGECPLLADLDADGVVAVGDLLLLLETWGLCAGCPGDLTGDGQVAVDDLLILLAQWSD